MTMYYIIGQGGDDILTPGSGYDILSGGEGKDLYYLSDTVIIQNYAKDKATDGIVMTNINMLNLVYSKNNDDLIIQCADVEYPIFIDGSKLTVIIKGWYSSDLYRHVMIDTADGIVQSSTLEHAIWSRSC